MRERVTEWGDWEWIRDWEREWIRDWERGGRKGISRKWGKNSTIIAIKYLIYRLNQEEHWPKDANDYSGTSILLEI